MLLQSACLDCNSGLFSYDQNFTACLACPPVIMICSDNVYFSCSSFTWQYWIQGTFVDKSASSFCNLCSYSKYSSGSATSCETCAANQNTTSNAKQSRSECRDYCGVGQVGYNGVQPCFPCLSGSFTSKLGTKCLVNENASISYWNVSGLVSGKGNGSCQLYFANDSEVLAAFGCVNCRAGYYQNMTGQTSCDICSFNVYAGGGATSCTPCPTGAVTLNKGSQSQPVVTLPRCILIQLTVEQPGRQVAYLRQLRYWGQLI